MALRPIRLTVLAVAAATIGLMASPLATAAPPDPTKEQVWVTYVNESEREIYILHTPPNKLTQRIYLEPGDKTELWGSNPAKHDLSISVRWCRDQLEYEFTCPGLEMMMMKWKNPAIGWPWMETAEYIEADGSRKEVRIRFAVGESHTWYPFGRASRISIVGTRKPDQGAKVWRVAFQNVS